MKEVFNYSRFEKAEKKEYILQKYDFEGYKAIGKTPSKFDNPNYQYILAQEKGNIIGEVAFCEDFFDGWPPHYFISEIDSYAEGQEIGSRLVASVEEEAIKNGIYLVALRFKMPNLWKKLGYEIDNDDNLAWKNLNKSN